MLGTGDITVKKKKKRDTLPVLLKSCLLAAEKDRTGQFIGGPHGIPEDAASSGHWTRWCLETIPRGSDI